MNEEKLKAFLAKEYIKKQEQQTNTILHNIPASVMVYGDGKLKIANQKANQLLKDLALDIGCFTNSHEDATLDYK